MRRSVFVGAFANEVDGESAVVMQEHVGAVAVDGAVGEQHADGECGLHVIRQIHELLVGVPIRMHGDGRVWHVGVSVAVLVHIAHERQIPSVMIGELLLEILYLGECFIADAQVFATLLASAVLASASLSNMSRFTVMTVFSFAMDNAFL